MGQIIHWHCIVTGRVQGVYYRARVAEAARRLGVVGYVANRADGTVFIDAQGDRLALEAFLRDVSGPWGLSNANPPQRVREAPVDPGLIVFEIRRG